MCSVITPTPPKERQPGPMEPGRICMFAGCDTRLSTYNPSETCSRHGGWQTGKATAAEVGESLADLVEAEPCA